jgi:hypothetical protein
MCPGAGPADRGVAGRSTVLALAIPHLLAHLASSGVDASPIRSLAGIRGRDLDDPDLRLPDAVAREAGRAPRSSRVSPSWSATGASSATGPPPTCATRATRSS